MQAKNAVNVDFKGILISLEHKEKWSCVEEKKWK
jgi:hypothetical protein